MNILLNINKNTAPVPNLLDMDAPKDDGFGHFVGPTDLFSTPVLQQTAQAPPPTFNNNAQSLFNTPNQPTAQPQVSKQSILELYNSPMTHMPLAPSSNTTTTGNTNTTTKKANYDVVLDPVYQQQPVNTGVYPQQQMYGYGVPNTVMYNPTMGTNVMYVNPNVAPNMMYQGNMMYSNPNMRPMNAQPNLQNPSYVNANYLNSVKPQVPPTSNSLF